ncbi:GNAT family N-acetyltransferase [uncultured Sphingomonas sp.]|uniref:GNAT family N-acetyltransferase n=1 Tax=uncultured Sphingomonas sp. TaxID=158754 RepID=UPI0025CF49C0|nr:GNAT family N-acetyltransferase [uncultured Sphingomonas sp.]
MAPTFHEGELDREDVQALLSLHFAAMRSHSPPDACHVLPAAALRQPSITFFSGRGAGELLGIGALKELDPFNGEIKSMRTAPTALGQGVGRLLLGRIVEEARRRGYRHLSLETGSGPEFTAALRLYEGAGFRPCAPFGGYLDTPFTRVLSLDL